MEYRIALRAYRSKQRLTQDKLAQILEVDERVIRRWENGESKPNSKHAARIKSMMESSIVSDPYDVMFFPTKGKIFSFALLLCELTNENCVSKRDAKNVERPIIIDCEAAKISAQVIDELLNVHRTDIFDRDVNKVEFKTAITQKQRRVDVHVDCQILRDMPQPIIMFGCRLGM